MRSQERGPGLGDKNVKVRQNITYRYSSSLTRNLRISKEILLSLRLGGRSTLSTEATEKSRSHPEQELE